MATTKKAADAAKNFEAFGFGADAFKEGYERFSQSMTSVAEFQQNSMNAYMASFGAFTKGVEKLTTEQAAFVKATYEDSVAAAKASTSSKSAQEAMDLNSEFIRSTMEKNMGQASKVAEICTETAKLSAEPLTDHYSEFVEKVQAFRP